MGSIAPLSPSLRLSLDPRFAWRSIHRAGFAWRTARWSQWNGESNCFLPCPTHRPLSRSRRRGSSRVGSCRRPPNFTARPCFLYADPWTNSNHADCYRKRNGTRFAREGDALSRGGAAGRGAWRSCRGVRDSRRVAAPAGGQAPVGARRRPSPTSAPAASSAGHNPALRCAPLPLTSPFRIVSTTACNVQFQFPPGPLPSSFWEVNGGLCPINSLTKTHTFPIIPTSRARAIPPTPFRHATCSWAHPCGGLR